MRVRSHSATHTQVTHSCRAAAAAARVWASAKRIPQESARRFPSLFSKVFYREQAGGGSVRFFAQSRRERSNDACVARRASDDDDDDMRKLLVVRWQLMFV